MKQGYFEIIDKEKIFIYVWDNVENPKGVVQIFHGMAEHAGRYENFAKFLNKNGYIVVADDHRGHGKTAGEPENVGKYNLDSNILYDTLIDELRLSKSLVKEYKLPLYVFGHSYGSFICQAYIEKGAYYKKAIICGSALMKDRLDVKMGKLIALITQKHKGKNAPAKLVAKLSFGKYDKQVKTGSWLNTDNDEVKKYYADPYCGITMSAKFYVDFFRTFDWIYKKDHMNKINKSKPILLISGKDDPVGSMGKSVNNLYKFYKGYDLDVEMKLYKNARHEILNEPIKQTVYNDILKFIEKEWNEQKRANLQSG